MSGEGVLAEQLDLYSGGGECACANILGCAFFFVHFFLNPLPLDGMSILEDSAQFRQ